ncbi:MAG: hypothetical protein ACRENG_20400, partial [bacterium]
ITSNAIKNGATLGKEYKATPIPISAAINWTMLVIVHWFRSRRILIELVESGGMVLPLIIRFVTSINA